MAGDLLLERAPLLAAMAAATRDAAGGAGRMVVVEGGAGLGKTRVVTAGATAAAQTGFRVLSARGSELEREFAFGVARQLFGPAVASRPDLFAGAAAPAEAIVLPRPGERAPCGDFAGLHGLFWLVAHLC